jgi:hypothetical protein
MVDAKRQVDLAAYAMLFLPETHPRLFELLRGRVRRGEVRQQFSVCFACRVVGGDVATSDESLEVGFFAPAEIASMPMHESIRLRIQHYLEHRLQPVIA